MKLCSFDARSKGQPWPLPYREVKRIERAPLLAAAWGDALGWAEVLAVHSDGLTDFCFAGNDCTHHRWQGYRG